MPVLTEGFCVVQKEDIFNVHLDEMPSLFIRDKPISSSERMLNKDYYHTSSVEKKAGRESQGA
jgi:hypothetical protein